jgi:CRP-like cAMP-binding protein
MLGKLLLKLRARDEVTETEERVLRNAVSETKEFKADEVVVRAETETTASNVLIEGIACRYKDLGGGERQITELHVPGDFVDLHSFPLKRLDHHVLALTPCRFAIVPHERLKAITEQYAHLTRLLWFLAMLDASIHREWMLSLGRRPAVARIAHLFCEMNMRLGMVGLANGGSYDLPLTQTEMAECKGITAVHVNRTLKELREEGLVTFRGGSVTIHDLKRLEKVAEFNPSYLYLERRPR